MSFDAKAKVCGLLGYPVGHSVSPAMHNYFAEKCGINMVYVPLPTPEDKLKDAVAGCFAMGFAGMNVTIPHKIHVCDYVCGMDDSAKLAGAVNTLKRTENGYIGYNTDMYGLARSIKDEGIQLAGSKGIIIGAGGAANAAAAMFAKENAEILYIVNRTKEKAQAIADHVNDLTGRKFAIALSIDEIGKIEGYQDGTGKGQYIAVQATKCGMTPDVDGCAVTDPELFRLFSAAVDIIFNPSETKFMQICRENGVKTIGGLKMLLYQGVEAFEIWNEMKLSDGTIKEAYSMMERMLSR